MISRYLGIDKYKEGIIKAINIRNTIIQLLP